MQTPLAQNLLAWFDAFGRKDLPWQPTPSAPTNVYYVWLSEVMLQQTQVATVVSYFNNFILHFPDFKTLANATEDDILAQWSGLGYYARARNLHKSAQIIVRNYRGVFPITIQQVVALPGIGVSTAGAILSLAYNQNHPILDGNVRRVLSRYHQLSGHYGQNATLKQLWRLAKIHTPTKRNANYTQAIMDLGAMICTSSRPNCLICPINKDCLANKHSTQSQYPNPKPPKNKPTKTIAMLVFRNKSGIYLQKRPSKGIWGGLWSFVECENTNQAILQTIQDFCKKAVVEAKLATIKHSFSHYHLSIAPIIVRVRRPKQNFLPFDKIKLGLPAPVRKIIQKLD